LPGYRGYVVDSFPKLFALDDKQISKEERINCLDFKLLAGKSLFLFRIFFLNYIFFHFLKEFINQEAEIKMSFLQLKNLIIPEQPEVVFNEYFGLKKINFFLNMY